MDIYIRVDLENAATANNTLKEFNAPLTTISEVDFAEEGYFYQMGHPPMRVDILRGIPRVDFDGLSGKFISQADLITAKKASGRPQELIDADLLSQKIDEDEELVRYAGSFCIILNRTLAFKLSGLTGQLSSRIIDV